MSNQRFAVIAALALLTAAPATAQDLTGRWCDNWGTQYMVRQAGADVCWRMDGLPRVHNVFCGSVIGSSLVGSWLDLPGGQLLGGGRLILSLDAPDRMSKVYQEGNYGGSVWTRAPEGGCPGAPNPLGPGVYPGGTPSPGGGASSTASPVSGTASPPSYPQSPGTSAPRSYPPPPPPPTGGTSSAPRTNAPPLTGSSTPPSYPPPPPPPGGTTAPRTNAPPPPPPPAYPTTPRSNAPAPAAPRSNAPAPPATFPGTSPRPSAPAPSATGGSISLPPRPGSWRLVGLEQRGSSDDRLPTPGDGGLRFDVRRFDATGGEALVTVTLASPAVCPQSESETMLVKWSFPADIRYLQPGQEFAVDVAVEPYSQSRTCPTGVFGRSEVVVMRSEGSVEDISPAERPGYWSLFTHPYVKDPTGVRLNFYVGGAPTGRAVLRVNDERPPMTSRRGSYSIRFYSNACCGTPTPANNWSFHYFYEY